MFSGDRHGTAWHGAGEHCGEQKLQSFKRELTGILFCLVLFLIFFLGSHTTRTDTYTEGREDGAQALDTGGKEKRYPPHTTNNHKDGIVMFLNFLILKRRRAVWDFGGYTIASIAILSFLGRRQSY